MNILLLEPDGILGKTYAKALREKGHKVSWCRDSQSAIQSSDKDRPDVIVAELQLARHNGVEFLYELRSYSDWQDIPVIVLSHVPSLSGTQATLRHLNVKDYLYKPRTKLQDLVRAVNQVVATA